jgi:hypothetical protein
LLRPVLRQRQSLAPNPTHCHSERSEESAFSVLQSLPRAQFVLDMYCTYVLSFLVNLSASPRRSTLSRHRDKKPVTASPLESAFTKRDARNSFRMRSYENCRVAYAPSPQSLKYNFNFTQLCLPIQPNRPDSRPFFSWTSVLFHFPYTPTPLFATLTKTAGVYTNSSHFGTPSSAPRFDSLPHDCLVDYSDTFLHTVGPAVCSVRSTARPGSAV